MARSGGARSPSVQPSSSRVSGAPPLARSGRSLLRRRLRNPAFAGRKVVGGAAIDGGAAGERRSGPSTPFVRWKYSDADQSRMKVRKSKVNPTAGAVATTVSGEVPLGTVSARKLAAGIWQLQLPEFSTPVNCSTSPTSGHGRLRSPHLCEGSRTGLHRDPKDDLLWDCNDGASSKPAHSPAMPNPAMERATKWDPEQSMASGAALRFFSQMKLLEDRPATSVSAVSRQLQAELEEARAQIGVLEAERHALKKKLNQFLNKVTEEKAAWKAREREKAMAAIDDLREALAREKKNRRRVEMMNSKLMEDLAEAELAAKRHSQDLEKERKARKLVEEVCDELAKEIGEDKAELEVLRRELSAVQEEVEEERKMLQMAEVWREERVQMKLVDAKLVLEEKYSELSKLRSELEALLGNAGGAAGRKAEMLRDAAEAAAASAAQEIKEFVYQPPPEDIFSVFEELRPAEDPDEREVDPCRVREAEEEDDTAEAEEEDESGWETTSNSRSVNGCCRSNGSTDWEENAAGEKSGSGVTEEIVVCSAAARQPRKKMPAIARLWRSSSSPNGGGVISDGTRSPDAAALGNWGSPDSGKKACIEWPRGGQKHSLKAKLLEARLESQKIQLRHVLRQKI